MKIHQNHRARQLPCQCPYTRIRMAEAEPDTTGTRRCATCKKKYRYSFREMEGLGRLFIVWHDEDGNEIQPY